MNMTSMSEANNEVHRPGRMKRGKPRLADMGCAPTPGEAPCS